MKTHAWKAKYLSLLFLLIAASALAADGPRIAMGNLYKTAQKGKLKDFRALLTGEALEKYGNAAGMELIRQERQANSKFEMEKEELPSNDRDHSFYQLQVFSEKTGALVRSPRAVCDVDCVYRPEHDPFPHWPHPLTGSRCIYPDIEVESDCQLSSLD